MKNSFIGLNVYFIVFILLLSVVPVRGLASDQSAGVNLMLVDGFHPIVVPIKDGEIVLVNQKASSNNMVSADKLESEFGLKPIFEEGYNVERYKIALFFHLYSRELNIAAIKKWFGKNNTPTDAKEKDEQALASASFDFIMDTLARLATDEFYIQSACKADMLGELNKSKISLKLMKRKGRYYCNANLRGRYVGVGGKQLNPFESKKYIRKFFEDIYPKLVSAVNSIDFNKDLVVISAIDSEEYDFNTKGFALSHSWSDMLWPLSQLGYSNVAEKQRKPILQHLMKVDEDTADQYYTSANASGANKMFFVKYGLSVKPSSNLKPDDLKKIMFRQASFSFDIRSDFELFLNEENRITKIATIASPH